MAKAFLSHYKKRFSNIESDRFHIKGELYSQIAKDQLECFLKLAPSSSKSNSPPPPNPLTQLADISLALQQFVPQTLHSNTSPLKDLHSSLARLMLMKETVSKGSHFTPPPAHASPVKKPPSVAFTLDPPNISAFSIPTQSAPEDLRVIVRKLDLSSDDEKGTNIRPCPECGKVYTTSSNLARHRQTHRSPHDQKARQCPHCDKTYVSMPAYSMHLRTHNLGCQCPFCGKCFSRPWLLQGHVRTHTGERPFKCSACTKSFADKSNLRAHLQTHSDAKPFACSKCAKTFALKSYLYKHEESSCLRGLRNGDLRRVERKKLRLNSDIRSSVDL